VWGLETNILLDHVNVLCSYLLFLICEFEWHPDGDNKGKVWTVASRPQLICTQYRSSNGQEDVEIMNARRIAGGVAVYQRLGRSFSCYPILSNSAGARQIHSQSVADISFVKVGALDGLEFTLGAIYIHPRASRANIETFLSHALSDYSAASMNSRSPVELNTSLMLSGDFNINVQDDPRIIQFMVQEFNMSFVESSGPTTLNKTIIDLTFTRNLTASCMLYIAYFSDHRPLFNKIMRNVD
jgi:hypothetical protein